MRILFLSLVILIDTRSEHLPIESAVKKEKKKLVPTQTYSQRTLNTHKKNDKKKLVPAQERTDAIGRWRYKIHLLLQGQKIDSFIGVIIVVNSATIGMQISYELEGRDTSIFQYLEYFYVIIYSSELALRFFASRMACFQSGWVQFDAFLVGISYFSLIVEPMIRGVANIPVGIILS